MLNKTYTQKSFKRVWNAIIFSYEGMKATFKSEAAFRQDTIIFVLNCVFLFFVQDKYFVVWLFFCGLFLLFAELINTAIECVVDYISNEIHPLAKHAKDIGSALVFISIVNFLFSWSYCLYFQFMK